MYTSTRKIATRRLFGILCLRTRIVRRGEPVVRRMVAVGGSAKKMIHFHSFPKKDVSLLKKWLVAMKRDGFTQTKHSRICGKHFLPSHYYPFSRMLLPTAVPSIFDFPAHLQKQSTDRRPLKRTAAVVEENQPKIEDAHPSKKVALSPSKDSLKCIIEEQKRKIKVLQQKVRRKEAKSTHYRAL